MRPVNEIIVHCSATRADWMAGAKTSAKVAEIRRWHTRDRGWKDIGYHVLIDRDGTVAKGRPIEQVGAHVQGKNTGTIGVCLMGGHGSSEKDKFADHFTPQQEAALRKVLADLMRQYPTITKVSGHNQYAAKACPGFNVPSWYAAARASVTPKPGIGKPIKKASPAPNAQPNAYSIAQWLAKLFAAIFTALRGRK
jgi:N-acetylmuramoyl-L-alanine amidase